MTTPRISGSRSTEELRHRRATWRVKQGRRECQDSKDTAEPRGVAMEWLDARPVRFENRGRVAFPHDSTSAGRRFLWRGQDVVLVLGHPGAARARLAHPS